VSEKLVKLTINGKTVEVPAGTSVFSAATSNGIEIPHYCYHPDLSVAGVCRMCMCEIEKNPRLQISCNTPVSEGMVVRTDTEKVKDTVKSVLELHLINHPLDCPICDKAGECKLQDFYADYGLYESRMDYDKVHKPKVQDIGTIVLDSERCILCSRCVRFTAEVTKTNELGIFNRGDRSVLGTVDNQPLRNDYTGNLADICPVGALTAKDFRFKQRVWFLDKTKSICTLCAHGCNTVVSKNPQTQKLFRVEPRRNPDVNKSWMCDSGRWDFHFVHDENRIAEPFLMVEGKKTEQTWHSAFQSLGEELEQLGEQCLVALSTQMTNEEIIDSVETLGSLGVKQFTWIVDESLAAEKVPFDGILKHRDLTPNAAGFEKTMKALAQSWLNHNQAKEKLKNQVFGRVLILGLEGHEMPGLAEFLLAVPSSTKVAIHATSAHRFLEKCDWVLPNVSAFEKSGTMINAQGRIQKLQASVPRQFLSRDSHQLVWGITQKGDRKPLSLLKFQDPFKRVIGPKMLGKEQIEWRTFQGGDLVP